MHFEFPVAYKFSLLLQDTPPQSNHMNNLLTDMYRTNPVPTGSTSQESRALTTQNEFPIDISSDESDVEDPMPKGTNNGKRFRFLSLLVNGAYILFKIQTFS